MSEDTDDTQAKTRHKKKLEKLREKEQVYDDRRDRGATEGRNRTIEDFDGIDASTFGGRETSGGSGKGQGSTALREDGYARGTSQGIQVSQGTDGRSFEGVRSPNPTSVNTTTGHDRTNEPIGAAKLTVEQTPEEKAEHERELARQRKQRQRDKEKSEAQPVETFFPSSNRDRDRDFSVTQPSATSHANESHFHLRNPIKLPGGKPPEPVKLLSKTEADDARESLIDLVCKLSSLPDDFLEIVVRGHEEVTIWEMDIDEAALWVDGHLKRAQKEQDAARTVRVLLGIYDRFFTIQYLWSRSKRTVDHIKDHGGLSFR